MKFDFNSYEFTALVAPGSVIVITFAFLNVTVLRAAQPALLIAAAIVAAYVAGHLIAAIGNLAGSIFAALGAPRLETLSVEGWLERGYLAPEQLGTLQHALSRLKNALISDSRSARRIIVSRMRLMITRESDRARLDTFNGLYNLSRGFVVAFVIAFAASCIKQQYAAAAFSLIAAALMVYRVNKFNGIYSRELLQQVLAGSDDGFRHAPVLDYAMEAAP